VNGRELQAAEWSELRGGIQVVSKASPTPPRLFDLNIDKFLEHWGPAEGVREILANALDEQALTDTRDVEVVRERSGVWIVRDYGRGIAPDHLTQNENPEKKRAAATKQLLGRFGVGLKDALATLDRNGVKVAIRSRHAEITLARQDKHGFAGIRTLHAAIRSPLDERFVGTEVRLEGIKDEEVETARSYFLRFVGENVLDTTNVGQVIARKTDAPARIYVRGLRVAEEENFAFSYNVTDLTRRMEKALNRERTAVGRTVYTDRVKAILLAATSKAVARRLMDELGRLESGETTEEIQWLDVQERAVQILNAVGRTVFVTADELRANADLVEDAEKSSYEVVVVPGRLRGRLADLRDTEGEPVRTVDAYAAERAASFAYSFLSDADLSVGERGVWALRDAILSLAGGKPPAVKSVVLSATLRPQLGGSDRAIGVWEASEGRIVIHRAVLRTLQDFASTLLHEMAHVHSGSAPDVTREFEHALTELLGEVASRALAGAGPR
jgi:hypothetical protein